MKNDFERIISNLLDVVKETDTWIRLFVMTSEKNHDATVNFLKEKKVDLIDFKLEFGRDKDGKIIILKIQTGEGGDQIGRAHV